MANPLLVELRALSAVSASGSGSAVAISADLIEPRAYRTAGRFTLNVAALSAGAVLKVSVETSLDGVESWRLVDQFPARTTPGRLQQSFAKLDKFVRVSWELQGQGPPSATFGVDSLSPGGGAHQVYLVPEDITCAALQEQVLAKVPLTVQADATIAASGLVEGALIEAGKTGPFYNLDERVRQAGISLAACRVLSWKGFNPDSQADQTLLEECTRAREFLTSIADGQTDPVQPPDPGGLPNAGAARIVSQPSRNW